MNEYFASEELVYKQCKRYEFELTELIAKTLNSLGNRFHDDCLQDIYIEAIKVFLNTNLIMSEFKKALIEMAQGIAFGYYWGDKKEASKPRGMISEGQDTSNSDELDSWLWERVEDRKVSQEQAMIFKDELANVKEYKGKYLNFDHAKELIHFLQLKNIEQWELYVKNHIPKNIPANPDKVYKKFISWDDWLGVKYFNYEDCKNWVQNNLTIKSIEDWVLKSNNLPTQIPSKPNEYYSTEWQGWNTFLGLSSNGINYISYEKAREWVETNLWELDLTEEKWENGINDNSLIIPETIPINPDIVYKHNGWISWFRWFSKEKIRAKLLPMSYHQCSNWVKVNLQNVNTKEDWDKYIKGELKIKKPSFIPNNPENIYRGLGWHGWYAFLNNPNKSYKNNILGFNTIRVLYNGDKLWVKPISTYKDTITGKVLTAFCLTHQNSVITFNVNNILGDKIKKNISTKIKMI